MEPTSVLEEVEISMEASVEQMAAEFGSVRTGKASPALVENVTVEVKAYGSKMKLRELAVITTPEPRQISGKRCRPKCQFSQNADQSANFPKNADQCLMSFQ